MWASRGHLGLIVVYPLPRHPYRRHCAYVFERFLHAARPWTMSDAAAPAAHRLLAADDTPSPRSLMTHATTHTTNYTVQTCFLDHATHLLFGLLDGLLRTYEMTPAPCAYTENTTRIPTALDRARSYRTLFPIACVSSTGPGGQRKETKTESASRRRTAMTAT